MGEDKGKILFIEDDEKTQRAIISMLEKAGFQTVLALSAAQGFQLAVDGTFDCFLVEWSLQDVSGLTLCRKLKEFDGKIPVYLYTGNTARPDLKEAAAAGANGCIDSPISVIDLTGRLITKRLEDGITD
jgi:DNA-binding response OmpR family regulator